MAYFHKNLKYHDDTTEKHCITNEELTFLMNLQKEMNTQDVCSQAEPRFWIIQGSERQYNVEDYIDDYVLVDSAGEIIADGQNDICVYINDNLCVKNNFTKWKATYNGILCVEEINYLLPYRSGLYGGIDNVNIWLEQYFQDYRIVPYKTVTKNYENTMFLTQKAAEDHLKANSYHYSADAHTYAMTAWRSPEVMKLWSILRKVDWKLEL